MTQTNIVVRFQLEGFHNFPAAKELFPEVGFLADRHRHIFHFELEKKVNHDDRDVEFIQAKRTIERWYNEDTLQLNHKSCEMIAKDLHAKLIAQWPDRDYVIEVSEDGENGCRMYFTRD